MYTYDAIGSYERTGYSCQGSGQALIMPVLDNQLKAVSPLLHPPRSSATPLTEAEAIDLVKDCFATAGAQRKRVRMGDAAAAKGCARARMRTGGGAAAAGPRGGRVRVRAARSAHACPAAALRAARCALPLRSSPPGERDIFTGDAVDIVVINAAGVRHETLQLKLD